MKFAQIAARSLVLVVLAVSTPAIVHAEIDEADIASTVGPADMVPPPARQEDRGGLRDAINASERARVTRASRPPMYTAANSYGAPQQSLSVGGGSNLPPVYDAYGNGQPQVGTQVLVQSQSTADSQSGAEVQNSSRSEMMRRERVREEITNEDVLQERLESLRLRDERQRLGTITSGWDSAGQVQAQTTTVSTTQVQAQAQPTTYTDPATVEALTRSTDEFAYSASEKTPIYVQGRGGMAIMNATGQGYDVFGRYALGVGLGFAVSSNLSVEAGFSFNEYGVAMNSGNSYYQNNPYGYNQTPQETVAMKQNVIDLGVKFHVLGPDSRIRPFISGGAGYSKSFINFDQAILQQMNQYGYAGSPDYEVSSFLGYLGTGADVRISRAVSLGANFRYYGVFSSRENQPLNGYAMNGYSGAQYYGAQYNPNQQVGGSLAKQSFYSLFAGLTFVF